MTSLSTSTSLVATRGTEPKFQHIEVELGANRYRLEFDSHDSLTATEWNLLSAQWIALMTKVGLDRTAPATVLTHFNNSHIVDKIECQKNERSSPDTFLRERIAAAANPQLQAIEKVFQQIKGATGDEASLLSSRRPSERRRFSEPTIVSSSRRVEPSAPPASSLSLDAPKQPNDALQAVISALGDRGHVQKICDFLGDKIWDTTEPEVQKTLADFIRTDSFLVKKGLNPKGTDAEVLQTYLEMLSENEPGNTALLNLITYFEYENIAQIAVVDIATNLEHVYQKDASFFFMKDEVLAKRNKKALVLMRPRDDVYLALPQGDKELRRDIRLQEYLTIICHRRVSPKDRLRCIVDGLKKNDELDISDPMIAEWLGEQLGTTNPTQIIAKLERFAQDGQTWLDDFCTKTSAAQHLRRIRELIETPASASSLSLSSAPAAGTRLPGYRFEEPAVEIDLTPKLEKKKNKDHARNDDERPVGSEKDEDDNESVAASVASDKGSLDYSSGEEDDDEVESVAPKKKKPKKKAESDTESEASASDTESEDSESSVKSDSDDEGSRSDAWERLSQTQAKKKAKTRAKRKSKVKSDLN